MRRERIAADQAFFTERIAGRPAGARRSRRRAEALAIQLGIDLAGWRERARDVVIVVGSKGKGTAATYASAGLAAAGLRVGTLTSPGLRSNRERIRVDGAAIARNEYQTLVEAVSRTVAAIGHTLPDDGYLAPTGLFTLAALRHFAARECDAVVLEAGMGGAGDEVSLLAPGVVVVGAILAEHIGILGASVAEIAAEKLAVVRAATSAIVAQATDDPDVSAAIRVAAARAGCPVLLVERREPLACMPPGLSAVSARAGIAAAAALLELRGTSAPEASRLAAMLASVHLPGRLSTHPRGSQAWIVDAATNPEAIRAALAHSTATGGAPTAVLLFVPYQRDPGPLLDVLSDQPVVRVRAAAPTGRPGEGAVMGLDEIDLDGLGPRVLALGPVYFIGEVLALLDVDCERSFSATGG